MFVHYMVCSGNLIMVLLWGVMMRSKYYSAIRIFIFSITAHSFYDYNRIKADPLNSADYRGVVLYPLAYIMIIVISYLIQGHRDKIR